jgi:hypothetical protein
MLTIPLYRGLSDTKQTLGQIISAALNFHCDTLELPWKNNEHNVSCIPANKYLCKWTRSNRMSKKAGHDVFTYEIMGVPDRAGIRIHSANYFHDLLGCIAFGDGLKDLDMDTELDVIHSGNTIALFARLMDYQDFYLEIKDAA